MIIKEDNGAFEKITELYPDDLELIVSAANIAGYMENAEKIYVDEDRELAAFCAKLVQRYNRDMDIDASFQEFAEEELLKKYGIENL